jgi:hypothetical protein
VAPGPPGFAIVTAKFKVGEDMERSLRSLQQGGPTSTRCRAVLRVAVKPMGIDDVPIVTLTLYSSKSDDYQLRRVADELLHACKASRTRPGATWWPDAGARCGSCRTPPAWPDTAWIF